MADRTLTIRITLPGLDAMKLVRLKQEVEKAVTDSVGHDAVQISEALMIAGKRGATALPVTPPSD